MPQQVFAIINPAAGSGLGRKIGNELLERGFELSGWGVEFTSLEGKNRADNLARKAQEEGYDRIVVVGGEGTIRGAVSGLSLPDPSISMGIVPIGRVNNLANALGLPKNVKEALGLALRGGNTLAIDLGAVNKELFVSTFGTGIDARTNETAFRINAWLKKTPLWRPLAWFGLWEIVFWTAGLSREIGKGISSNQIILKGDIQSKGKIPTALLTVNNVAKYAHRFWLTPGAQVNDGLLDVCLIKGPIGRGEGLALACLAMRGTHIQLPKVSLHQIQELVIECEEPLVAQIDGEPMKPASYFEVSVFPRALNVVVPNVTRNVLATFRNILARGL